MSKVQAINWVKWGTLLAALALAPMFGGWIGKSVDIIRTPDQLAATRQDLFEFKTNSEAEFRNLHDENRHLGWKIDTLLNAITNRETIDISKPAQRR